MITHEDTMRRLNRASIEAALGPEKLVGLPLKVIQEVATKALIEWALHSSNEVQ
jgi:hypothetical protein